MIRVGIIGCGKIADDHVEQIQYIQGTEIVGVCDKEELMAKQLYERYEVKNYFKDVDELLELAKPDIVHITTPPQSHFDLGKRCLNAGCHVYIEKPFTLNTGEANELIQLAKIRDLKITVGHNYQFDHAMMRMRELIKKDYLGGPPILMESYYGYDLGDLSYAKALLGNNSHWVRKLPGKLLQNIISHGISSIAEYIMVDEPKVIAYGYTSSFLKSIGETDIIDELRVIIHDDKDTTAHFTFSSQIHPILHQFRTFGLKNGLIVDHIQQTIIKIKGTKYKSYLEQFIPPFQNAKQYVCNSIANISHFVRRDFHMSYGMRWLIASFYDSVTNDAPLPIPYREIILTSKIMDNIFEQLNNPHTS
jgi:predicted dehydrogenase